MAGTQQSTGSSTAQSSGQSGQYFYDPTLVGNISKQLGQVGQQAGGQYMGYVQNPTASPLYQNTLSGLLGALAPSERQATTNLSDMFRGAGNMASGAYGTAAANLQGNMLRNRQELASNVLAQQFPQMTQALFQPMSLSQQLLNALKLSQSSQQSTSQSQQQSSGSTTDPMQQQQMQQPQGSGVTASQLLAALKGMQGGGGGTTGVGTGPTSPSYGTPTDQGLLGYGQAYDQYGNPVNDMSGGGGTYDPGYTYQFDPNAFAPVPYTQDLSSLFGGGDSWY